MQIGCSSKSAIFQICQSHKWNNTQLQPYFKQDMSQQNAFYLHPAVVNTSSSNVISSSVQKLLDCTTCVKPGCRRGTKYICRWNDTIQTSIKRKWNIVHTHCKLSLYQCSLWQYNDITLEVSKGSNILQNCGKPQMEKI